MEVKIFYCYANEDKGYREILEKHLSTLRRSALVSDWSDRNIDAGKEWAQEIDSNLNIADIILLLISPDFMHSDYCHSIEMKRALERHENKTARVIPIILRHGDYEGAAFYHLQALPTDAVPVTDRKWHNRDKAFANIAQGIRKVVKELFCEQCLCEGNIHFYRQQYSEALSAFEKAIYHNPSNAQAYIGKGQTLNQLALHDELMGDHHYEEALAAFEQAIELEPSNSFAYEGKGTATWRNTKLSWRSRRQAALSIYGQAISLDPKNEAAYIGQGKVFILFSRYEEALAAFENAIEVALFPNQDAYEGKVKALYNLNRYEETVLACEQSIQNFPGIGSIYETKGDASYKLGLRAEAMVAYEEAISLGCKSAPLHSTLGSIFSELGVYQRALDEFEQAIHLNADAADAYRGKGNALKSLADKAFEKAKKIDDEFFEDHPF